MATSKKSLASRAGSVVRRAVRGRADTDDLTETSQAAPVKKAPAKTAARKTAAKAPAKTAAKKTAAKKTAAKKAPAKKAAAKKAPATTAAKKTTTKKTTAKTAATAAPTTKKASVTKAPAKSAAAKKSGTAATLVVREGESPWTEAELDEVREHLRADIERLGAELQQADTGLHDLMIDSGDGSGHDQADVGSSSFERDHEISIANNARDMFEQSQHALQRIDDGSYGVCERNEEPIGKLRLMAFPRATLCMTCKQREERR